MSRTGVLDVLIRRARRRCLWNLIVTQAIHAACVAMGGVILLLLVGTQILDWPWLLGLFGASFALGFYWTAKRFPSSYAVAQAVDRNLDLHDSLSTALFYNRIDPERRAAPEMRASQLAFAESAAERAELERAIPLVLPRSVYMMAALGIVASSLFALRYGISRTLDLRAPFPRIVLDALRPRTQEQAKLKKRENQERLKDLLKQFGLSLDNEPDKNAKGQDADPTSTLDTVQKTGESAEANAKSRQNGPKPLEIKVEQAKQGESPEGAGEGAGEEGAGDRSQPSADSQNGDQQNSGAPGKQASNSASESNSLLDKFRDAMANLLSRMKPQQKPGESQQAANSPGRQDSGQMRQSPGQKGSQADGRQQSEGLPNSGSQENGEDAEGAQKATQGPGKRGWKDSDQRASQEGRSGIGKEDGSKELKEAEQLAAMGKISEIIGKRSQNLTGEVMVEVASGKQQLRTAYSQQSATHAEAGGEIRRDEIPLAYQRYVQQYFEEIRKPANTPPAAQQPEKK